MPFTDKSSNIIISPSRKSYQSGDKLFCSADGFPPPTYQWTNLITEEITNDSILVVSGTSSQTFVFQCTARNTVGGNVVSESKIISFAISDGN